MSINPASLKGMALTVAILGVVVFAAGTAVNAGSGDADAPSYGEKAAAYCHQAHGDADLSHNRVIGNHGGLHCEANEEGPHLHDVTDEALTGAYIANQSNASMNWDAVDRYEPWHQRGYMPDLIGGFAVASGGLIIVIITWGMSTGAFPRP